MTHFIPTEDRPIHEHITGSHEETLRNRERMSMRVAELWLQGCTVQQITETLDAENWTPSNRAVVIKAIRDNRDLWRELHAGELEDLAAERIEGYRTIQRAAWIHMSEYGVSASLLSQVKACEDSIARIQGVLTDKLQLLGKVEHEYKLYDFRDNTPSVGGAHGPAGLPAGTPAADGEYRELFDAVRSDQPQPGGAEGAEAKAQQHPAPSTPGDGRPLYMPPIR